MCRALCTLKKGSYFIFHLYSIISLIIIKFFQLSKLEEEEKGKIHDPTRWMSFVANNLLAYTAIFQQLLPRFMRIDLVAPKNALMLFRVTKVIIYFKKIYF